MKKGNNYFTIFGLNNIIPILKSNKCSKVKVDILKGSKLEKNFLLNKLLKEKKIIFNIIDKNIYNKKYNNRNQSVAITFYCDLIKTIIPSKFAKKNICFLVLDQINDPQNFGQIIRTAECSGIDGIIYSKHNSVSLTNIVLQVSQGSFLNVPIYEVINIKNEIKKLKNHGFWVTGMENSIKASNWFDIDYKGKSIIVFGSEGKGIREKVLETCDFIGTIEMQGEIDSLNVGASVSAVLFERLRQIKGN